MGLENRIADLAAPGAAKAGLIVDSVEVDQAGSRQRVVVFVDLPDDEVGSASLDAIAEASRAIGAALDEANVPPQAYVLEVSTPGISRPLTERRHFLRARTRMVSLDLNDGTVTKGRLTDIDGDEAVLDGERRIPLASIVVGSIEVDFKGER
ncbi:MAG TPA: ribosome maturation factor RimP [Microbacterium sp.]|nr:ribosome maturation factor RimP [Microbacterium sp.]